MNLAVMLMSMDKGISKAHMIRDLICSTPEYKEKYKELKKEGRFT